MTTISPPVVSDEFILAAFERCPSGLMVVNSSGQIITINREVERQFGYLREELLGRSVEILVPESLSLGHSTVREQYAAVPIARHMGAGRELFGRHKDGHEIPVEIGLSSISTPEGLFVLATIVDVSERRCLEGRLHQLHKLEALGGLASGIAHDFNNILTGIVGYAELARNGASGMAAVVADLDVVLATARQGRDSVSRILSFTRPTEPRRVKTDFKMPVRSALLLLRASLPANIEIREWFDPDTPEVVADEGELHQIAMNLATNAAHAMKSQGGSLEIRLAPASVDQFFAAGHPGVKVGLYARLTVADTGAGIPSKVIDRIFEPFFTTKLPGEGTGLGLSVIDRIVRSLGGTVDVKSRVGEGARFDVYVPAADARLGENASAPRFGRSSILLVDDEESLVRLGQRVLESADFDVTTHTSSLQALESFRANPEHFDLLITDNTMPHMTGIELVERVLAIRPNMPVLMLSGVGESMPIEELKRRGVSRLLAKPYESSTLKSVVKELIETSPNPRCTYT